MSGEKVRCRYPDGTEVFVEEDVFDLMTMLSAAGNSMYPELTNVDLRGRFQEGAFCEEMDATVVTDVAATCIRALTATENRLSESLDAAKTLLVEKRF